MKLTENISEMRMKDPKYLDSFISFEDPIFSHMMREGAYASLAFKKYFSLSLYFLNKLAKQQDSTTNLLK